MTGELRADARRNRDQILMAARGLIVEHGVGAPMDEIARRAGVGIGTLYRRFPDRTALLRAVSVHTIEQMTELARSAWDEESDAWNALSRFVRQCTKLRLGTVKLVVEPQLPEIRRDPEVGRVRSRLMALIEKMVVTSQQDGAMRTDVGAGDVTLLFSLHLRQPIFLPEDLSLLASDRLVELMLDGLRTPSVSPLPGRSLSVADIEPRETE